MKSKHQKRVEQFMHLAKQKVPNAPINKPTLILRFLRAKLILEEALETVEALGFELNLTKFNSNSKHFILKDTNKFNLIETVDGCADLKVVVTGTLSSFGLDDEPIQELVDNNNLAKFAPGSYIDNAGKLIKPPNHQPPDIQTEIERQINEKSAKNIL